MKVKKGPISICVVEDDTRLLENLRSLLSREKDLEVVAAYACPQKAINEVEWGTVRVLLTDLDLPALSGVEVIRSACAANPDLLAMAYTVCENRQTVFAAIQAGAFGYVLKGSPVSALRDAIYELVDGGSPMSPTIARMVLHDFKASQVRQSLAEGLSEREVQVLRLIAKGLLYKEVADELGISTHTVHTLLKRIYAKLHVHNRRAAVRVARQTGQLR